YELEEYREGLKEVDVADCGNMETRLVHLADPSAASERFAGAIGRVQAIMPEVEIVVQSPAEIGFRRHGLEFARARLANEPGSFRATPEIAFGLRAEESILTAENSARFEHLVCAIGEVRHADGPRD